MINKDLLEVTEYNGEGYLPLLHYGSWRVAELRYCDELLPANIKKLQKHNETDEIFVLLSGDCVLFIAQNKTSEIQAQRLSKLKIYNVKKGTWHSHTLSKDAAVLIVENDNTSDENSAEFNLSEKQHLELKEQAESNGFYL